MSVSPEPLADLLLSSSTVDALGLAASQRDGEPVSTFDLLVAIMAVDPIGNWEGVQVQSAFLAPDDALRFADAEDEALGVWHNVPLTRTATEACGVAARIAKTYRLLPVPPGVLALGLVWDPSSGAARAMLDESNIDHGRLLEIIQDEILDTQLEGLETVLNDAPGVAPGHPDWLREGAVSDRAPSSSMFLRRAAELDEKPGDPGALSLIWAAVELNGDVELGKLLDSMMLQSDQLAEAMQKTRDLPEERAAKIVDQAQVRFKTPSPDPAALVAAVVAGGGERVDRALHFLGLSSSEVLAQVAEWRLRRDGDKGTSNRLFAVTMLKALITTAVCVLVVLHVLDGGGVWKLLFIVAAWYGYPQFSPLGGIFIAAAMAWAMTPLIGAVHFGGALFELLQAATERRLIWSRTGVRLSFAEQRRLAMRFLNDRARTATLRRQRLTARLRQASDTPVDS